MDYKSISLQQLYFFFIIEYMAYQETSFERFS